MGSEAMSARSVHLVPPTLRVIALLMTNKIELHSAVTILRDRVYMGHSYGELGRAGYPLIKVDAMPLGFGLTVAYTERRSDPLRTKGDTGLVWVNEIACHPGCAILGRKCQAEIGGYEWLKRLEEKHLEWLDRIPRGG